jgi:outer membrane protein TolC
MASALLLLLAMTLPEAREYARAHHPQIKSGLAELRARRAEAKVARAEWLPQIGATLQIVYGSFNNTTASYFSVPEVDLPRIGGRPSSSNIDWSGYGSTLAGISLGQEVYDFGRIAAKTAIADAQTDLAQASAAAIELDIQLGVEETYAAVLSAKEVLRATEEALRRAQTHRDFAQAGTKSGMRPSIDLTRAQADVALLGVKRIRAESGLKSARAALAASIGSDALEIDAVSPEGGVSLAPAPAFEEVLRNAAADNPAIAGALARLRAQMATSRELTRELWPELSASAGLNGRAGGAPQSGGPSPFGDGWLPGVANWHLGLVLRWNLFDGTVLARRQASRAREQAMQAELVMLYISLEVGGVG